MYGTPGEIIPETDTIFAEPTLCNNTLMKFQRYSSRYFLMLATLQSFSTWAMLEDDDFYGLL